ncbi:MAG: EI24 domain-containing protein [Chitinophagaceae bacterium]
MTSLAKSFMTGLENYAKAFRFLKEHKLYKLLFLSFIFYFIIIAACAYFIWIGISSLTNSIYEISFLKKYISNSTHWLADIIRILFYISSFFIFLSFYKFIFLALASPLFAYISEKTDELMHQKVFHFSKTQFVKDIYRGVRISMTNMLRQLGLTLLFIVLSFIPIIGFVFTILILILDCYYYGFSMLDYNCERNKMNSRESRAFISEHKGLAIGNGLVMYLSLAIPIVGVVLMAPISAIAGTLSFYQIYPKKSLHE